ncbi:MAG: ABC transporter ATP-binding protein [Sporolactobacillus sp.]
MRQEKESLLEVRDLQVSLATSGGHVQAVRGINFNVERGETLAIVGESGCGKSVTSLAVMGLLPPGAKHQIAGSIRLKGKELLKMKAKERRKTQGVELSMIFQDPMTALNPTLSIGSQLTEGLIHQKKISRGEAKKMATEMLNRVGIPSAEERMKQYPHQLSGGMRQRIVIAMALICGPELMIADEPTTALDVTIQAQILDLLYRVQKERQLSIIMITHDLGVVAKVADRIAVMYAGQIVEIGEKREIFYHPQHPYTQALLRSVVRLDRQDPLQPIQGTPPDLFAPPPGCAFSARCPFAMKICERRQPPATFVAAGHSAHCWLLDRRAANHHRVKQ